MWLLREHACRFVVASALGRIVRVTDEVVAYRAWIRETYAASTVGAGDSSSSHSGSELPETTRESGGQQPLPHSYAMAVSQCSSKTSQTSPQLKHG